MRLIVGLGNPGKQYQKTRHNIGFMVLDALRDKLAESHTISEWTADKKFNAMTCGTSIGGEKIILAKPLTFMNLSGQAVQQIAAYYKVVPDDIIVVHDEKDIPLGEIKQQSDRGHAGHNGIKSIIQYVGNQKFGRIRVGVASSNTRKMDDTAKFVLSKFGIFEKKQLRDSIARATQMIYDIL